MDETATGSDRDLIARAREAARAARDEFGAQPPPSVASDHFPGYQIVREIHRGGQGVVYQAIQLATKRRVAIKVMHEGPHASPADRKRFEREVEILAQLHHPNIVAIVDSGVAGGSFYYIMDYISGRTLDAYIRQAELPKRDVLVLCAKICDAINAAHLRGVIHRDIKPSNIRVDASGEPHIVDFGLAKIAGGSTTGGESPEVMTMTGQFIGSLPWASPEQAEGSPDKIDVRTDVYSLGVVIYQVLTGAFPYEVAGNMRDVLDNILRAEPRRPSTVRRHINDEVETIVLKCLSKERERRYQSAGEIARDLRHYLAGEPIEAKRDSNWYVISKLARRYRAPVAVAAAAFLGLVVFAIVAAGLWRRAEAQSRLAEHASIQAAAARDRAESEALRAVEAERSALADRDRAIEAETLAESRRLEAETERNRAVDAERRALADRERASAERTLARQTRDFLFDAILASIPRRSAGEDVLMIDFLRGAADGIDRAAFDDPVERATIRTTIGLALHELGFRADAVAQLGRAVEVLDLAADVDPADIRSLRARRQLATALRNLGETDRSQRLFDELAAAIAQGPPADRDQAIEHVAIRNDRAQLLKTQRRFDECERELSLAASAALDLLGEDYPLTLRVQRNHAEVLRQLERGDEAKAILDRAIPIAQRQRDRDEQLIAAMTLERATMNKDLGDMDAAARDFSLAVEALTALHRQNPMHRDLLNARFRQALFLYRDAGRPADAEPILLELVEAARNNRDIAPSDRAIYLQGLGWAIRLQGRLEEAEGPLVEGFEILRDERGLDNATVQTVLDRVIELYEQIGDESKVAQYRQLRAGG